jgi:hypothetical protein
MWNDVKLGNEGMGNEYRATMPKSKASRSEVITEALVTRKEQKEVPAEGYRFYAQEASEFAVASQQAVSEVFGFTNSRSTRPGGLHDR